MSYGKYNLLCLIINMDTISLIDNDLIQLIKYKQGKIKEPNQISMINDKTCFFFLMMGNKELVYQFITLYFWDIKAFTLWSKIKIVIKYITKYWFKKQIRLLIYKVFKIKLKI